MVGIKSDLPWKREVYSRDLEDIQVVDRVLDVFGQHHDG
jgi:hypothetical protein